MKKYEYLVESPLIKEGEFNDGCIVENKKGIFGKDKTVFKDKTITEKEWLDRKGQEGWELVNIFRNGMSYDIREYYFKRALDNINEK